MQTEIITAIIGAISTIAAALMGIWFGRRPPTEDPTISSSPEASRRSHQYDVFVSAPIAGFSTDEEIQTNHDRISPIVKYFEIELGFKVFWAGRDIRCRADFEAPDISAIDDVQAIRNSKYFLLLYPNKILSSVLFEAGIALRSCLVSIYIVNNKGDLPFLMDSASQAFSNVRIYKATLPDEALALIRKHGKHFFDARESHL
jgi:hypothetical protein